MAGSTIAAIATASGGGVGIIRVSGPAAESIGQRICRPWPQELASHHLYLGHAAVSGAAEAGEAATEAPAGHRKAEAIDQVLFCLMRAPRSYTGEDVLEIHGHGGAVNLQRLLDACYQAGATAAAPGEFTRRAFLAGKLDLTQAEAVASLVSAQSTHAARQAQRQLSGELAHIVAELRRQTVGLLGEFEGMLDFPDLEVDAEIARRAERELDSLLARVTALVASFQLGGRALQCGLEIAVLGRPNVGKSSLINALCGCERVLVDDQPGTTRDYVEVRVQWDGVAVTLIDTAGERVDANRVELQGMRLGRQRWRTADLCLVVVDGADGLGSEEQQLLAAIPDGTPRLIIWNKMDRAGCQAPPAESLTCSALCGWGLSELRQAALSRVAPRVAQADGAELLVTSARQAATLDQAGAALRGALAALTQGAEAELVAAELRVASTRLGELTGHEVSGQVLDAIFARFCVGK